ncbi:type VI secretion system accessory protein TagJ [Paraburkholderia aspalathi]|uniref:type VI secretion system accessory protein TagJ n=1 Tax=Paraburkholderia aspalathi TaxID=1324617 RepID=UPI0038BA2E0E
MNETPDKMLPTLRQTLHIQTFTELNECTAEAVRQSPADAEARWLLFQLLCIGGEWLRALKHLQVWAMLTPRSDAKAQLYRGLVQAEIFRADVFAGSRTPRFVASPPAWVTRLLDANASFCTGDIHTADQLRQEAFDATPQVRGSGPETGPFDWIADSDTRLGPMCEMATAGGYCWIPFEHLRALSLHPVTTLIDLVWRPAALTLREATVLKGYMPTRYIDSESSHETLKLAQETTWTDTGTTHVIGKGQKTWTTNQGDWGLLDITSCEFMDN